MERALGGGCVELMTGEGQGLAARIRHKIVAMKQAACCFSNLRLGCELPQARFHCADVVDGETEVADAERFAVARLQDRDVVKPVGERDIAAVGPAKLSHGKVAGVKTREHFRTLADDSKVADLRFHVRSSLDSAGR